MVFFISLAEEDHVIGLKAPASRYQANITLYYFAVKVIYQLGLIPTRHMGAAWLTLSVPDSVLFCVFPFGIASQQ